MAFRHAAAAVAALLLVLLLPSAAAHTAVFSADERVRGSIGLLNEPTSTYAVTGLDACFTYNTAAPRTPLVGIDPANFTVTLRSPSGALHQAPVEVPFGRPNCLTFETPLVLTEPGQYFVDLTASVNGTTFDVKDVKAGGEVLDREDLLFPREESAADDGERGLPPAAAPLLMVGLAVLAGARRLR